MSDVNYMFDQSLEHICGKDPHVYRAEAILQKDFPKANPFTRFVRGEGVEIVDGQLQVTPSWFR